MKIEAKIIKPIAFHLPPFRALQDKHDERRFVDDTIYLKNDAESVRRRARWAMLGFHALLLLAFALSARRVFGDVIALAALAFLVVERPAGEVPWLE